MNILKKAVFAALAAGGMLLAAPDEAAARPRIFIGVGPSVGYGYRGFGYGYPAYGYGGYGVRNYGYRGYGYGYPGYGISINRGYRYGYPAYGYGRGWHRRGFDFDDD
jgi:hypothetical protein